jgi:hypothetical protein
VSAISISVGLLIALLAILVFYRMRKLPKDRRVRITKNVPVLRIDHISIKGMLLGVWSASYRGECDSGY